MRFQKMFCNYFHNFLLNIPTFYLLKTLPFLSLVSLLPTIYLNVQNLPRWCGSLVEHRSRNQEVTIGFQVLEDCQLNPVGHAEDS